MISVSNYFLGIYINDALKQDTKLFHQGYLTCSSETITHIILSSVAQGDIFMEQKMRFGLVLGRLAILKKKLGADYEQLLRVFFSYFQGQNNN